MLKVSASNPTERREKGADSVSFTKYPFGLRLTACLLLLSLMVLLRVVSLESDAYLRLSWSSGLFTDEGFYIHNARNLVLFGIERTDEFNNALMMPTLHTVQVGVFRLFGVGAIQARSISVVASLLGLVLFYLALKRAFGMRVAVVGLVFLGLDHVSLLYHRMALMDTPASLLLLAAFWMFVYALPREGHAPRKEVGCESEAYAEAQNITRVLFSPLFLCGVLLVMAYVTRGLSGLFLPVPLLALWSIRHASPSWKRAVVAVVAGIGLALAVYFLTWYLPHRAELTRMNRHYMAVQLLPHSLIQFGQNLGLAWVGDARGMASYLFRHTPIQFSLVCLLLAALVGSVIRGRRRNGKTAVSDSPAVMPLFAGENCGIAAWASVNFLIWWLVLAWGVLSWVNYNPSRYYVLFYPAMSGLAALAVVHWRAVFSGLQRYLPGFVVVTGLLGFHLFAVVIPALTPLRKPWWIAPCLIMGACLAYTVCKGVLSGRLEARLNRLAVSSLLLLLWAGVNAYWLTDWLTHLTYRQKATGEWLTANLPPDSVLLGAWASAFGMNTRFKVVSMIKGLCNDDHPVERFAPAPRYVLILDENDVHDGWKEKWWVIHYPEIVARKNRLHAFRGILRPFFTLGLYTVPPQNYGPIETRK